MNNQTGSTKSYSNDPMVSDTIKAIFTVFKENYKVLFKRNYKSRENLMREMALWQMKLKSDLYRPKTRELLKQVAVECCSRYEYPPNLAQFMKVRLEFRTHAAHEYAAPALPRPPRTEEEKAKVRERMANLRSAIQ